MVRGPGPWDSALGTLGTVVQEVEVEVEAEVEAKVTTAEFEGE